MAKRLNISASAVGMYEQGRREPSIEILTALAREFGVTIDYLVTGSLCAVTDPRISKQSQYVIVALTELNKFSREDLLVLLLAKIARE